MNGNFAARLAVQPVNTSHYVLEDIDFQFEWDETKAAGNLRKHRTSFHTARTIFGDPHLLTIADLEHSQNEDRWFSMGATANGTILSVSYLWTQMNKTTVKIRLISARVATQIEMLQYRKGL